MPGYYLKKESFFPDQLPIFAATPLIFTDKAKVEDRIETIFDMLEERFGKVPQVTKDAVAEITDLTVLRRLTSLAWKCKTLNEFAKAVK